LLNRWIHLYNVEMDMYKDSHMSATVPVLVTYLLNACSTNLMEYDPNGIRTSESMACVFLQEAHIVLGMEISLSVLAPSSMDTMWRLYEA